MRLRIKNHLPTSEVGRWAYSYELAYSKLRSIMLNLKDKVLQVVSRIPKGETLTYKEVARRAGNPRAYRAVGNILNKNFNPKIPCHRVIRANGQAGGYRGGTKKKLALLREEKALGIEGKIV